MRPLFAIFLAVILVLTAPLWFPLLVVGLIGLAALLKTLIALAAPFAWQIIATVIATMIAILILDRIRN